MKNNNNNKRKENSRFVDFKTTVVDTWLRKVL